MGVEHNLLITSWTRIQLSNGGRHTNCQKIKQNKKIEYLKTENKTNH